jgi:hypothetical protein
MLNASFPKEGVSTRTIISNIGIKHIAVIKFSSFRYSAENTMTLIRTKIRQLRAIGCHSGVGGMYL